VIVEDRGLLALLFLNNNFHAVHHMHPTVAWYKLPGLYAAQIAHYQRRNEGYVYRSYAQIFRSYFLRVKDPVPHPLMDAQPSLRNVGTSPELSKNGTPC
jgi:fatty acid desaturase